MSLPEVLGQEAALTRLARMLERRRVPSALLFYGPDGVGKRLSARLFAAALECERDAELQTQPSGGLPFCGVCAACASVLKRAHPNVLEVDDAFQAAVLEEEVEKQKSLRVDTARELTRLASLKTTGGRWKVFILDNAHRLEPQAANALLKALEEPAPDTVWILIAPRRESLLATVQSRCQPVAFRALNTEVLLKVLARENLLSAEEARRWTPAAEGSLSRAVLLSRFGALVDGARGGAAYWQASQSLPRELAQAREAVDGALEALLAETRENLRSPGAAAARAAELMKLKRALRANVSPQLILQLALLKTEGARA